MSFNLSSKIKNKALKKMLGVELKEKWDYKFGHSNENEFVVLLTSKVSHKNMKKLYNRFLKSKHKVDFDCVNFSVPLSAQFNKSNFNVFGDYFVKVFEPGRFVPKKYEVVFLEFNDVYFELVNGFFYINFEFVGVHK